MSMEREENTADYDRAPGGATPGCQPPKEVLRAAGLGSIEILESVGDGFYTVDTGWRFTYVNRKAEQLFRKGREDLIGRVIWDEFPEMVDSEAYEALLRAAKEHRGVTFQVICPVVNRWVEAHVSPNSNGISLYFRDITDRERAEAERARLAHQASERTKELTALHEIARVLHSPRRLSPRPWRPC
jgi:PAS domain S-box-containing protein